MRRRRFVALAASAGSAAIAGCGDASDDPGTESTDRAEGQQHLGGRETAMPGENGTDAERATPRETATGEEEETPTESDPETATPEDTATETDTETPEDTPTETETATPEADAGAEQGSVDYPEDSVDVRGVEYDPNTGEDAGPTVSGVVENGSGETLRHVEVRVEAFTEDDERLGDALDDATDLADDSTWRFNCELWDTDAGEIEYWTGEVAVSRRYEE